MKRLLMSAWLSLLPLSLSAKEPSGPHLLDGKRYTVDVHQPGALGEADQLTFSGGTFSSKKNIKEGYGKMEYRASIEDHGTVRTIAFNARGARKTDKPGLSDGIVWSGNVETHTGFVSGRIQYFNGGWDKKPVIVMFSGRGAPLPAFKAPKKPAKPAK